MSASQVIRLTSTSQARWRELLNQPKLTVLCWSMIGCGPCEVWAPVFERLAKEHVRVNFAKAVLHEVDFIAPPQAFPTTRFYVNGRIVDELRGVDEARCVSIVRRLCPNSTEADWSDLGSARALGSGGGVPIAARALSVPKAAEAPQAAAPVSDDVEPDADLLAGVCALGVPEQVARRAVIETANDSVEAAVNRAFEIMDSAPSSSAAEAADPYAHLSPDERAQQLQALLRQKREEAALAEEKRAQEAERQRIEAGKKAQDDKDKFDREQKMRDYDEARREAEQEAQWRRQVLAKIKRQQQQRESDTRLELLEDAPAASSLPPRYVPPVEGPCELQIRMPDGTRLRHTFKAADTVLTVQNWIEANHHPGGVFFLQTPTAQIFQGDKVTTTLSAAGLPPRGVLVVKILQL